MLRKLLILTTLLFLFDVSVAQSETGKPIVHGREGTEWIVHYSYNATSTDLPRVLLIGDSICNQYQKQVCKELAGSAYVTFFATSKCLCDASYLRTLAFFLDEYDYAVVHFNNGLHSLSSNRKDWETRLRASIRLIQKKSKDSKIIWASSTPLKKPELTEKAKELNTIAARVMKEEGIPTNDLFALMDPLDRDKFWRDTYHYKGDGMRMLAAAVTKSVQNALGLKKATEDQAAAALKAAQSETGPDGKVKVPAAK
ncbi:MAG: SGNH/GDSL hydrolase family protein [Kiritimatiellae bacterium]|jgi:hypothetical protein|nr:SGNH/GDSL hydrolase family protein [Kiritimatiellia bacterium]